MTRLPTPGGDAGNWGTILNEYLSTVHNTDGSLKPGVVAGSHLADGSITTDKLADASITTTKLASSVQTTLSSVVTTSNVGVAGGIAGLDSSGKVPASQLPEASGGTTPEASATVSGTIRLSGDLGGTASSPTVTKLSGVSLSGTPSAGQALVATSSTVAGWQTVSGGAVAPGSTLWSMDTDPATTTATQGSVEDGDMWVDRMEDPFHVRLRVNGAWVSVANAPKPAVQTSDLVTGLTVTNPTSTGVTLSWTAPANPSGTVDGYHVYNNGTKLTTTPLTVTTYNVTLPAETAYSLTVAVVVAGEEKTPSPATTGTTPAEQTTTDDTVTGLSTSNVTSTGLTLSWTAPANPSGTVEGYHVYNNGTKITTTLLTTTTYNVTLPASTAYSLTVASVVGGQEKTASTAVTGTTPGTATTTGLLFPSDRTVKIMPLGDSITVGFAGSSSAQQGILNHISGAGYRQRLWKDIVENTTWKTEAVGRMSDTEPLVTHPNLIVGSHVDAQHVRHSGFGGWDALDFYTTCPNSNHTRTSGSQYFNSAFGGVADWINDYTPDIILLEIGTNDINQWIAPTAAEVHDNIRNLVTHIYSVAPNMTVFVSTIPPIPSGAYNPGDLRIEEAPKINPGIPAVVQQFKDAGRKIYFADICSQLTQAEMHDVHPSDAGYAKMALNWKTALENANNGQA